MSINYFLSSKKKLQKILSYLNEIKLTYCEIRDDGIKSLTKQEKTILDNYAKQL